MFEYGCWPVLLPTIAKDFNVSTSLIAWIFVAFALGMAGTGLTVAHLGDVSGHKRMALLGFGTEATMLALAALMPALWPVLGLRFIQGIGRATGLNNIQALAIGVFPRAERGRALGISSALVALGLLTGPPYAGFVAEHFGWRAAIAGVVAIYGVQIGLVILSIRGVAAEAGKIGVDLRRLDWPGAGSFLLAITSLLLAAQFLRSSDTRLAGAGVIMVSAGAFAAALHFERRSHDPVLNLDLFRSPSFASAGAGVVLVSMIVGASNFLLPFYMQRGLAWSLAQSGFVLMALNAAQLWGAPLSGTLADKLGARWVQVAGLVVVLVGLLLAAHLGAMPPVWQVVTVLLVLGSGYSLFMPPTNKLIYTAVPRTALGTASAVSGVGRYVGQSLGVAVSAMLLATQSSRGIPAAFQASMVTMTLITGIGTSIALLAPLALNRFQRGDRSEQREDMAAVMGRPGTDHPERSR